MNPSGRQTYQGSYGNLCVLSLCGTSHLERLCCPPFSWAQPQDFLAPRGRPRGVRGEIDRTDNLPPTSHAPPQGARRSGRRELRADARRGRVAQEDRCSAWRRLHLDPRLGRRHLVSRPARTRSPPRPPLRAGASLAALRERSRLPRGPRGLQGLGAAPPSGGCKTAAAAVALRLPPRLPQAGSRRAGDAGGGARRPASQ